MKKINDTLVYRNTSIVMFVVALIFGIISYYSIWFVEPKIKKSMESASKVVVLDNDSKETKENKLKEIDSHYKEAYVLLRDPQIFARYENFDGKAAVIKAIIKQMDSKISNKKAFNKESVVYLNRLFERRMLGSMLGVKTMIFFLLLSLVALVFYLNERFEFVKKVFCSGKK